VGPNGQPTRQYGITWSIPPLQIGYNFPYLIAVFSGQHGAKNRSSALLSTASHSKVTVEIRNILTQALVQQFELPHVKCLSNNANGRGPIYIASERSVWRLSSVSFTRQVDQLVEQTNFDEALSLMNQIDSMASDEKVNKSSRTSSFASFYLYFFLPLLLPLLTFSCFNVC
jgi:hypothetical protein